jgi:hypothetical protein
MDGEILNRFLGTWRHGLRPASPAAFGFALACVTAATLVCIGVNLIRPGFMVHAIYYPAILVATLVGGAWAGALALALGGIVGWWLFDFLYLGFEPFSADEVTNLFVYATSSTYCWSC